MKRNSPLFLFAARVLGARTPGELRELRGVGRFIGTFGVTILLPTILLSYFALSSIQNESLVVDQEVETRSQSLTEQILNEKNTFFNNFEQRALRKIEKREAEVSHLETLSEHLLVGLKIDPLITPLEGGVFSAIDVVEPFDIPDGPELSPLPGRRYRDAWAVAMNSERAGRYAQAASHYSEAAAIYEVAHHDPTVRGLSVLPVPTDPTPQEVVARRLAGQARLAAARAKAKAGDPRANDDLAAVYGDYADVRDTRGFLLGDLASFARIEHRLKTNPDAAAIEGLKEFVESLRDARWTLGSSIREVEVANQALGLIERVRDQPISVDDAWVGPTRLALQRRELQLLWTAEWLNSDWRRACDRDQRHVGFRYTVQQTTKGKHLTTASVWTDRYLYCYVFDSVGLLEELHHSAERFASLDRDVVASVTLSGADDGAHAQVVQLGPQLLGFEARAQAADPDALAERKWRHQNNRIIIIVLAIGMALVGIILSARLVTRELETARMKTDFAANVSHELRSPITQIRLKGEALQLDLVFSDEDRKQHYDAIVRESERLSRLVDNVLDFAAIERGAKKYIFRPEDPYDLCVSTVETHRDELEGKGLEVYLELEEDLPVVWVDREAIGQVLTNLLSNAAKYGSDGNWVGIYGRTVASGIEILVQDRGMGIPPEDLPHVFDNFFRSESKAVRRKKGTGIGLAIVRYIVEAHGGTITVTSPAGSGATFIIQLPITPPTEAGD